jgi:hypothetical protein
VKTFRYLRKSILISFFPLSWLIISAPVWLAVLVGETEADVTRLENAHDCFGARNVSSHACCPVCLCRVLSRKRHATCT